MKYCPQCNRQYPDAWVTFCTDDGALLREELSPAADPNWDPRIRGPQTDVASEQKTEWLPRDPSAAPAPGAWIAPDERPPMVDRPWQPPPPPPRPNMQRPPPGLAIGSFVAGIVGIMFGWFCMFPIPGIVAVILGVIALGQMRNAPNSSGKGLAIAGLIMGGINLAFILLWIVWFILAILFGW
jgi:hypothetical protein